ncbi:hypothetical protein M407DRAFT_26396 [Tulasnella calospora MUT 4182]|uniref:DUF1996 domain-containing protein n=1 Tax=Tulasnella calospora MUT 4182 TaxID=1051891 RepID=A0A0C3Q535_9AGAM|nr:hypothetical protein M407DRAFT_26396 [Tulasnella calospora MUT 4182]
MANSLGDVPPSLQYNFPKGFNQQSQAALRPQKSSAIVPISRMFIKPSFVAILASLASVEVANAWFRLPCTIPMVQERVDPIIAPGQISQHLHSIHGGNAFSMNL